ncbi:MAG: ADP-glyceromanno-heptose 6-epimerase, partial [Candidatus Wallbacteria bacterium]|nr:ADP-glyceromanno-heptose 6-epimerase [Candidatus Wallbacteria bacterium]
MKKCIIVTGGAGFIGSALIWALNNLGIEEIIAVDHLATGDKFKNLAPLRIKDYFEKDDFLEEIRRSPLSNLTETVFHLGACSSTTEMDASFLVRNNFEYSKKLCSWSLENGARFVYASSAATYGDGAKGFKDNREVIPLLRPLNPYGYSKHLFDCWAMRNGFLDRIAGLKYFNVFGPNEYHKSDMRSVVIKAYEQILHTGRVSLFKSYRPEYQDGGQKRDFIYVKDAVRA